MAVTAALLAAFLLQAGGLSEAVRAGDRALVEKLLAAGAAVNEPDTLGGTPLHDACWAGELEIARLLVERGARVNARHREAGSTPLHYAVITNHAAVVEFLLDKGADLQATYQSGSTPLHLAANRGYAGIAGLLIARGAEVNRADAGGATPLDEAAWKGHAAMVTLLIGKGGRFSAATLSQAVTKGHDDVVKLLLAAGADANATGTDGQSLVELALRYRQRATAEVLLAAGAKLDGNLRRNLARNAVLRGESEIVDLLVNDAPGATALLGDAALKGHLGVVKLLIAKGANVRAKGSAGSTPLHEAALGGHAAVCEFLLDTGAAIDAAEDESGAAALHLAASYGRREVILLLLERGADPKKRNAKGRTAREVATDAQQSTAAAMLP